MEMLIDTPKNLPKELFQELLTLIKARSPVDHTGLEGRLLLAEQVALQIDNGKVITTATLKNPVASYKRKIFSAAGVFKEQDLYKREIGYIATAGNFEGKKLCQGLLTELFVTLRNKSMFATTRDPAMMHILSKFGFERIGKEYNDGLVIMVRKALA